MSSKSFFNQKTILNIKKAHNGFLWVASGVLILSLLLGAILIFVDTESDVFAKVQATFSVLALAAFICVNNFIRIEKGDKMIQGFAMTGLVANVVWLCLGVLMIWGALSPIQTVTRTGDVRTENATVRTYDYRRDYDSLDSDYDDYDYDEYDEYDDYDDYDYDYDYDDEYDDDYYDYDYDLDDTYRVNEQTSTSFGPTFELSIATKLLVLAISIASIGFWVSNVLAIKERVDVVKALKYVAIGCQIIGSVLTVILVFSVSTGFDQTMLNMAKLLSLMSSGFIVTALAAWIISITHKDFEPLSTDGKILDIKPVNGVSKIEEKSTIVKETRVGDEAPMIEETHIEREIPVAEESHADGEALESNETHVENEVPTFEETHAADNSQLMGETQAESDAPSIE